MHSVPKSASQCVAVTVGILLSVLAYISLAGPVQIQRASSIDPGQTAPAGGNGDSCEPILSADGRYVLFASTANNLTLASNGIPIPSPVPARFNVYLRDRASQTTTLISVNTNGVAGGDGDSFPVALSTNGQFVLFESSASDLAALDTNNATDIFLRDQVAGTTQLVSTTTNGFAGNGASRSSVMTPDARYVAFVSEATNIVAADSNKIADVFLRDTQALTTALVSGGAVSTNPASVVPACSSESPEITPDGRFIAFTSTATNLVAGVRTVGDVYVHDRLAGTNIWASSGMRSALQAAKGHTNGTGCDLAISADGNFVAYQANAHVQATTNSGILLRYGIQSGVTELLHANVPTSRLSPEETKALDISAGGGLVAFVANSNGATCIRVWSAASGLSTLASGDLSNLVTSNSISLCPLLDATGRYVSFRSSATGLVSTAVSGEWHVYQRDLLTAATVLVDDAANGLAGAVTANSVPSMSADGRLVAFESADASFVSGDNNHHFDIFVRDIVAGTNEVISTRDPALDSSTPNGPSISSAFSTSTDGRYIAFASDADNAVAGDTNGFRDVFLRDLAGNTNTLISSSLNGVSGNGASFEPAISGDGRYVAFASTATNLVIVGDTNKSPDIFVRDLQTGTTVLASLKANGNVAGNKASYSPMISSDGRWLLYRSQATDLAGGSFSGTENLFVRDLQNGTNHALTTAGAGATAMSRSGRFIAFVAGTTTIRVWDSVAVALVYTNTAPALVPKLTISEDGNLIAYLTGAELRIVNRAAQTNWLVASGTFSTGVVLRVTLRFSADGRWLTYARLITPGWQTFAYEVQNRVETLVSHELNSAAGAAGNSELPDISPDGRFVAYTTSATNIVAGINGLVRQIILYDRQTGLNRLASANQFGAPGDDYSIRASFSGDGQTLLFQSWASDLAGGDFNRTGDVFVHPILTAVILPPTAGQGPWLYWPFVPGNNYSVEFKHSLEDTVWQPLTTSYITNGVKAWAQDGSPASGQRVYRVNSF